MENSKKQQPAQTPGQKNPAHQNEKNLGNQQKEQVRPGQNNPGMNPDQNRSNRK